jgi:hypothetical protein
MRPILLVLSLIAAANGTVVMTQAHAAMSTKPPITIMSCRVENFGGYGGSVADVHITYKNTYPAPALKVSFLIRYHGQYAYTTDSGSFGRGVTISRRFHVLVNQPFFSSAPGSCDAVHATFADNSTWSAV